MRRSKEDEVKRPESRNGSPEDKQEAIERVLAEIRTDPRVRKMKKFRQHGAVSTYEHCENVTELSYDLNRRLHLHADLDTLLKGAMLHDFYLYDWHEYDEGRHRLHGFSHAAKAEKNAAAAFGTNQEINHVIASHMWPLNPSRVPRSKEAWIVWAADKIVSVQETLFRREK